MNDEDLIFIDDDDRDDQSNNRPDTTEQIPWKVLVVDDEEQVHQVTKLVLRDLYFDQRPIHLLHAYSGEEAITFFQKNNDIAICLLDVVMETESAGLDTVNIVRKQLDNQFTRIVLRTGQAGQAPEEEVIKNYDINDYKDKTELTHLKLHTLIYSCLRAYRDIVALDQTRRGLENVIAASNHIFSQHQHFTEEFAKGILYQVSSLMNFGKDAFYAVEEKSLNNQSIDKCRIIEGIGDFAVNKNETVNTILSKEIIREIRSQEKKFMSIHTPKFFIASMIVDKKYRSILYLKKQGGTSALQSKLLDIFSNNILTAFQNIYLMEDIELAQREMVYLLAEAIETRSLETGFHLQRVAELSFLLAVECNLGNEHAIKIHRSSPLHDLGKIAIPDSILNKPGKLTEDEITIMQTHTTAGYNMVLSSDRELCQIGRVIAIEHHERWDGKGYPNGLKEKEVSIEGRITAVADVFDALASKRCYKDAWSIDKVFIYMQNNAGTQFDPDLINILLNNKSEIEAIYQKFSTKN